MNTTIDTSGNSLVHFTLEEPEFDTSTYVGRFKQFQKNCNPLYAFYSNTKIN